MTSLLLEQLSLLETSKNYDEINSNSKTFTFVTTNSPCMAGVLQVRVENELFFPIVG